MPNYILPFPLALMNDPFGNRLHPIDKVWRWHNGADFGADRGAAIASVAGGTVIHAGPNGGEGISVHVRHEDATVSKGFHMSSAAVSVGERVEQGQTLGYVGSTGASTGPHYHLEIWVDGKAVDPIAFILAQAGSLPAVIDAAPLTPTLNRKKKDDMRFNKDTNETWWLFVDGKLGCPSGDPKDCELLDRYVNGVGYQGFYRSELVRIRDLINSVRAGQTVASI